MRGFPDAEFQRRTMRAQSMMRDNGLAALLLTTEPDVRYFSGYLTRFWESPTRPWFLIVPARGKPVAVIPSIGANLMGQTWIDDIRTWSAPDLVDDGIELLADALGEIAYGGPVGIPDGHETHVRMPLADLDALRTKAKLTSDHGILRSLRMVKSEAEIAKVEAACAIAGRAFARVSEIAREGVTLSEVFRRFQMLALEEGADWVPYLAGGAEPGGYRDVISPAHDVPLAQGDVLMLDTGLVWDGYFSDFDRNWSIGAPSTAVRDAHKRLVEASDAAFEAARPDITAADLFHIMNDIVSDGGRDTGAGRLGHGLGMSLTEWPSLIPNDRTVLEPGMVLTLEPGIAVGDKIMVHEENIVITANGARFLSPRTGAENGRAMNTVPYTLDQDDPNIVPMGLIVLQTDETIEPEFAVDFADDPSPLYVSRIASAPSVSKDSLGEMQTLLPAAANLLPKARAYRVVGYGCTSASSVIGSDRVAVLVQKTCETAHVTNPLRAAIACARHHNASKLALLSPYVEEVNQPLRKAFAGEGISTDVFGTFGEASEANVVRISTQSIVEAACRMGSDPQVEAVFLSCTNLRTQAAIPQIRAQIGKPVFSSNQCLAWHMKRLNAA